MEAASTNGTGLRRRRPWLRALLALLGLAATGLVALLVIAYLRPLATLEVVGRLALGGSGFKRASVPGPRGSLFYWRGGTGSLVVFLHGANDQSGAWARVAGPVKTRHRVLVPDLAGHGRSGPTDGRLSVADLLRSVEVLLDAEARGERAALVGNSMGGWLALLYAHRHPDRVSGVVLVNGAGLRGDGREAKVNLLPKTRAEARAAMSAVTSPKSPPTPDFILDDLVRRAPRSPLARLLASPFDELLLDGKLGEIQAPVTLLWGADDKLLPVSYAERLAEQLQTARLETIPGCGHIPQRECAKHLLPPLQQALDAAGATR